MEQCVFPEALLKTIAISVANTWKANLQILANIGTRHMSTDYIRNLTKSSRE